MSSMLPLMGGMGLGLGLGLSGGGAGYQPNAVSHGESGYLSKGTPNGLSDSKLVTFSWWFRIDTASQAKVLIDESNNRFLFRVQGGGGSFLLSARNAANSTILNATCTPAANIADGLWHWAGGVVNMANQSATHLYYDDTDIFPGSPTTFTDDTIDFTPITTTISAASGGGNIIDGCTADRWLKSASIIDFAVQANRELFRTAGGSPVDLGATGVVSGITPEWWFRSAHGTVEVNEGSGPNFVRNGTFAACGTTP